MSGRHAFLGLVCIGVTLATIVQVASADHRLVSSNTETLGDPSEPIGTTERVRWDALVKVLRRLDSDVVMLQEVAGQSEVLLLPRLADESGFSDFAVSDVLGTLSGGLRTACLSRYPIVNGLTDSWSAAELSQGFGDVTLPEGNDITRDIFHAVIEGDSTLPHVVFTVHLKSGGGATNSFRRQVEIERLLQTVELVRNVSPLSPLALTVDFNEDSCDGPFTDSWGVPPTELPGSLVPGTDIDLPRSYTPLQSLTAAAFRLLAAGHEEDPQVVLTRPISGRRLDLLWCDLFVRDCSTLVYESCLDDGIDAPPLGEWLPFAGTPLDCDVSGLAADHLPVVADLRAWDDTSTPRALGGFLKVDSRGDPGAALVQARLD